MNETEKRIERESNNLPKTEIVMTALVKDKGTVFEREITVATTLLARDWKGMNNYGANGVIVKYV